MPTELVAVEQVLAIARKGVAVEVQHAEQDLLELVARTLAEQLQRRHQQRRFAAEPHLAVDRLGQPLKRPEAVLGAGLGDVLADPLDLGRVRLLLQLREPRLGVEARVPDFEVALRGEGAHRVPVGARGRLRHRPPPLAADAVFAGGDREAGGEPLDVPLPRPRQRLVEVVEVEDEAAVGRREDAEVGEVGVAAGLDPQAGGGRCREIGRHHGGGAAEEGERRGRHPAVADRDQLRDPGDRLSLEDRDGVLAPLPGFHPAWLDRGARERAALPSSALSAAVFIPSPYLVPGRFPTLAVGTRPGATARRHRRRIVRRLRAPARTASRGRRRPAWPRPPGSCRRCCAAAAPRGRSPGAGSGWSPRRAA